MYNISRCPEALSNIFCNKWNHVWDFSVRWDPPQVARVRDWTGQQTAAGASPLEQWQSWLVIIREYITTHCVVKILTILFFVLRSFKCTDTTNMAGAFILNAILRWYCPSLTKTRKLFPWLIVNSLKSFALLLCISKITYAIALPFIHTRYQYQEVDKSSKTDGGIDSQTHNGICKTTLM